MAEMPTAASEITPVTVPLLNRQNSYDLGEGPTYSTTLAIFLGLFAGRRGASMIVRQSATQQLENWRNAWGYSLPVVALDTMWNLVFMVVSIVMLIWTAREKQIVLLRVWICVYALQCGVHVVLVWLEYKRRMNGGLSFPGSSSSDSDQIVGDSTGFGMSEVRCLDRCNTVICYLWWLAAFLWILPHYDMQNAPHLFWLIVTFMAIDVFFVVIRFLMEILRGLSMCFCFPCIMAFLSYVGGQIGASEDEIRGLPKYRFEVANDDEEESDIGGRMVPFETNGPDFLIEQVLLSEDADCCICLCPYQDKSELHLLPCNHQFHAKCIVKWLKISETCPLCKSNIEREIQV